MTDKPVDLNFLARVQKASKLDPEVKPGETAAELIARTNAEKISQMSQRTQVQPTAPSQAPQPREVVFYKGYKLSRDLFTCLTLCVIVSADPEVKEVLETFGFQIKDLDGKPVLIEKKKKVKRK